MKFLELRKYFFANLSAFVFYVLIYQMLKYSAKNYPPPSPNDVLAEGAVDVAMIIVLILILIFLYSFTILEFLIRKYIIERKFPNFKLNIKIKIPKVIAIIYNIIFSIGFVSAGVIFFIISVLFIWCIITNLLGFIYP